MVHTSLPKAKKLLARRGQSKVAVQVFGLWLRSRGQSKVAEWLRGLWSLHSLGMVAAFRNGCMGLW